MDHVSHRTDTMASLHPLVPGRRRLDDGQRLLTLVRSLCKDKTTDDESVFEEALDLLQESIITCQRVGFLQGDTELAEQVMASCSSTLQKKQSASKKKRGRPTDWTQDDDNENSTMDPTSSSNKTSSLDCLLVVAAIYRILETTPTTDSHYWLWVAASDWIATNVDRVRHDHTQQPCANAEYQLLAVHGKQFLTQLANVLTKLVDRLTTSEDDVIVDTVRSVLRASAALVTLFGAKLSRSPTLVTSLWDAAWQVQFSEARHDGLYHFASLLIVSVSCVGDPGEAWARTVHDLVEALFITLAKVAPIHGTSSESRNNRLKHPPTNTLMEKWWKRLDQLQEETDEQVRSETIVRFVAGLTRVLTCLLDYPLQMGSSGWTTVDLNVVRLLDLLDTMLSFSAVSEVVYFGTKKRLRNETVTNGLLSSTALVTNFANIVKDRGLILLDSFISVIDGSVLLPFAARIKRLVAATVLTSSSTALRAALDSSAVSEGRHKRWLHTSVTIRTKAFGVFRRVICAFGVELGPLSTLSSARNQSVNSSTVLLQELNLAISLVAGSIMEQLFLDSWGPSEDWGTLSEQSELFEAALQCITSCLHNGGEYLQDNIRCLLDSVANVCLRAIQEGNPKALATSKIAAGILELSTACVTTPWSDGAMSSISDSLMTAARICQSDRDGKVVQAAGAALQVCSTSMVARAPALQVVNRTSAKVGTSVLSIDSLIAKLQSSRQEIIDRSNRLKMEAAAAAEAQASKKKKKSQDEKVSNGKDFSCEIKKNASLENSAREEANGGEAAKEPEETVVSASVTVADPSYDPPEASIPNETKVPEDAKEPDENVSEEEDEDFPAIVDCGPDEGDEDSEG